MTQACLGLGDGGRIIRSERNVNERESPARMPDSQTPPVVSTPGRLVEEKAAPEARAKEPSTPSVQQEVDAEKERLLKKLGDQGNEIGELRRSLAELQKRASAPDDEADFFDDPKTAVRQTVEEVLRELTPAQAARNEDAIRAQLDASFPNWEETAAGAEFQNWVASDPERVEKFIKANNEHDYSSARSLFKTWDELIKEGDDGESRARTARAARTESGAPTQRRGKRYSRAQLRLLQETNRPAYESQIREIREAYKDGRVDP
jgi:hypothetical protein